MNTIAPRQENRKLTIALWVIFALYMAVMLKLLIFRGGYFTHRQLILTPFSTIRRFEWGLTTNKTAFVNIWGNIGMFVPMGLLFQLLLRNKNFFLSFFGVAAFSLMAETLQYVLGVGVSEVDDLILNTLGGLLGILLYRLLRFALPRVYRAASLVALVVMSVIALLITML